ncbi:MAG: hypothetical protein DA405_08135 [Bacteroidetes bacterium]|nr:MAG: hypothetical protein DA405_08135 [Bacteroidota bacterium]
MEMQEARKISPEELEYIFKFCKKKDIEFVDLRMELVDHLASRVEAIWEEKPELSFRDAFHKVYKSFGIFGLSTLVDEHSKLVTKKYWRHTKEEFKHWLKPPQIFATVLFMVLCYFSLKAVPVLSSFIWAIIYASASATFIYMFVKTKSLSKRMSGEKSMLLASSRYYWWFLYYLLILPGQSQFAADVTFNFSPAPMLSEGGMIFTSMFFCFALIFSVANLKMLALAEEQVGVLNERVSFYRV